MVEIITEARVSSSTVRAHEFPALEAGNISFPDGRYIVDFEPGQDQRSFTISHRVEGAPLINGLIGDRLAKFVCMVSSPASSYRQSHVSTIPVQTVSWEEGNLGEPPLFTPMIVAAQSFGRTLDHDRDGVHQLWHDQTVQFATGMRLAIGNVVQLRSSIIQMLSFQEEPSFKPGQFQVNAETQVGFRFQVKIASELHAFLRYGTEDPARAHIITHIVSACFALLKSDYSDQENDASDWNRYPSLCALTEYLKSVDFPHWSEGDDFRPEFVATGLHPHKVELAAVNTGNGR